MKSCWLCLHRGGAAKSPIVKHFCNMCHRIRSSDISLPNQIPCPGCVISGSMMPCVHHPVMDARTMQESQLELSRLEMCPIASHVMIACRSDSGNILMRVTLMPSEGGYLETP
jgi:hypothetical protein